MKIIDFNNSGTFDYTLVDEERGVQIELEEGTNCVSVRIRKDGKIYDAKVLHV